MKTHMIPGRGLRHYLLAAAAGLFAFLVATALLATSWNLFAPQLFGLEPLGMRGATGLLLFALLMSGALRAPGWRRRSGRARG
jgi:hypothetical protein